MSAEKSSTNRAMSEMVVNDEEMEMPTIPEVDGMKELEEEQQQILKKIKRPDSKPNTFLTSRQRRPLEKLTSLLRSKRRQSALQYLRSEFRRYAECSLHPPMSIHRKPPLTATKSARRQAAIRSASASSIHRFPSSKLNQPKCHSNTPVARQLSFQLLKRCLRWTPLPRLPPFHCIKCGLTSRRLRILEGHICAKRMPEYKNVAQTVELGFRSRVKDALAVLERIPRPQAVVVGKLDYRYAASTSMPDEQHASFWQPKTLFETAWIAIQRLHALDRSIIRVRTAANVPTTSTAAAHDHFRRKRPLLNGNSAHTLQQCSLSPIATRLPSTIQKTSTISFVPIMEVNVGGEKKKRMAKSTKVKNEQHEGEEEKMITSADGTAFFCRHCARLFGRYKDWDDHLHDLNDGGVETQCQANGEEPMEVQVILGEQFPICGRPIPDYEYESPQAESTKSTVRHRWCCTKCSTRRFLSRAEFHSHLLKCAMVEEKREEKGRKGRQQEGRKKKPKNGKPEKGKRPTPPIVNGWTTTANGHQKCEEEEATGGKACAGY